MVKPYYQDDLVTIYHGDCREWMPGADCVVTDPPYGVALETRYASAKRGRLTRANDYPPIHGDGEAFEPAHLLTFGRAVLWGAQYYADRLPASGQWLVWDKRDGIALNDQADAELAWTRGTGGTVPRLFRHLWNGMLKDSERHERRVHPTQKPIALMSWCLSFFPGVASVVDPYMGSGPTLLAAKAAGIRAIGIEIEERYCEIAAQRCSQEVLGLVG